MNRTRICTLLAGVLTGLFLTILSAGSVRAAEVTVKEVSTVEEFADAIASDTTIVLSPGVYNLTEWLNSSEDITPWKDGEDHADGIYNSGYDNTPEFMIFGIDNLTLMSADRYDPAEIVCEPRYVNVLNFTFCSNVLLDGLVMGHTPEQGECLASVLSFSESDNILVSRCDLYGCGAFALYTYISDYVTLLDCDVHDCTNGLVFSYLTDDINFIRTDFHDCDGYTMFELNDRPAALIDCSLRNLNGTFTDSDITLINVEIEDCPDGFIEEGFGVTEKPEAGKPETEKPETEKSETEKPETERPETEKPETEKPETEKPESEKPEAEKPEPEKPETEKPETEKPETEKPETKKPETEKPVKDTELIEYTVKDHAMCVEDDDRVLVSGNYFEILLSDEAKEKYPELADTLEYMSTNLEKELRKFLTNSSDYARDAIDNAEKNAYPEFYDEYSFTPCRADDLVFSWLLPEVVTYGDLYSVYAHAFTFDPQSGRSFSIRDVVKNPYDLPDILLDELSEDERYADLLSENPGIRDELPETVLELIQDVPESLVWALDYEQIILCFDAYDIGAKGSEAVFIRIPFEKYPELFQEEYVYQGKIPEAGENVTFEEDTPVTITYEGRTGNTSDKKEQTPQAKDTDTVNTLPVGWSMKAFYPEKEEDYADRYTYYTYTDLYTVSEEEYPALSKTLKSYNSQNVKAMESRLPALKNQLDSLYTPNDDNWPTFAFETDLFLNRADDIVVSFTEYDNSTAVPGKISSEALGINIDTETGDYIDLLDVVVSKESLKAAIEQELENIGLYVEDWKDEAMNIVKKELKNNNIFSNPAGLSFTIDYHGLTLIFNGSLTGYDDGPCTIFLSFAQYPELFNEKYMQVPDNYFIELATGDLEDIYWFDFNGDGKAEPFSVIWEQDSDGDYLREVSARWDDAVFSLGEVDPCYALSAYLVHSDGKDYLYIEATTDNDFQQIYVFGIDTEAVFYKGCVEGALKFMLYLEEEAQDESSGKAYLPGYLPTDPGCFKLETEDYTLGYNVVLSDHVVSGDGFPVPAGDISYYMPSDYWFIEAAKDIEAEYVKEGADAPDSKTGTIKKGTLIQPYSIDESADLLIIRTQDGKRWLLPVTEVGGEWLYDGERMDEIFANLPMAAVG